VVPDECEWQLDDGKDGGRLLTVTLRKSEEGWWDRVLKKASNGRPMCLSHGTLPTRPLPGPQDEPVDTSKFDDVPFVLGDMQDHQCVRRLPTEPSPSGGSPRPSTLAVYRHDSMRDHVARMFGDGSPGSAGVF